MLGTWDDVFYLLIYGGRGSPVFWGCCEHRRRWCGWNAEPRAGHTVFGHDSPVHVMERDFKTLDGEGFQNTRKQMLAKFFFFLRFFFFLMWTIFKSFYWICYSVVSVFFFFFIFWCFGLEAGGILAPWPGMEHGPPALESKVLTSGPPRKSFSLFKKGTKKTQLHMNRPCPQWKSSSNQSSLLGQV